MNLTRDQILEMPPGAEMDLAIAEAVFSWVWMDVPGGRILVPPEMVRFVERRRHQWVGKDRAGQGKYRPRPYSTDIASAWEVANKHLCTIQNNGPFGWGCQWLAEGPDEHDAMVTADTAPLAICRAALLATLVQP